MRNKLVIVAAILAALLSTVPVAAQAPLDWGTIGKFMKGESTSQFLSAVSTDSALICRYIGPNQDGEIAVDAGTGDLTFIDGTNGAEAATSTFECPVSGALGGVIDVSNGSCDTLGEVVDVINASSNWRCFIHAGLRSDSSNNTLATISSTSAAGPAGLALKHDAAVASNSVYYSTIALIPPYVNPLDFYMGQANSIRNKPFANWRSILFGAVSNLTYGSGTSDLVVYDVDVTNGLTSNKGSETVNTLWTEANGATTVAKSFTAWGTQGLWGAPGHKMVVRTQNSAAATAVTLAVSGVNYQQ